MDGMFRGRDNSEIHTLKFSASSVNTRAWKRGVTSQMPVAVGTRSSMEGAGRRAAVRHRLWKQAGHLRYLHKFECIKPLWNNTAFENFPHLQCSTVEAMGESEPPEWKRRVLQTDQTHEKPGLCFALCPQQPVQVQGDAKKSLHV